MLSSLHYYYVKFFKVFIEGDETLAVETIFTYS